MDLQARQKDGHEINKDYQQKVIETYLWLARTKPDWKLVDCMNGERRKTIEEVTEEVWQAISPIFSKNL